MSTNPLFNTRNQHHIHQYLSVLVRNQITLQVTVGNDDTFYATLVKLDAQTRQILVHFRTHPELSKKLQLHHTIACQTHFNGLSLAFEGANLQGTQIDGKTLFSMSYPTTMLWQERREFFRVSITADRHWQCSLTGLALDNHLLLHDISISGFAVIIAAQDTAMCNFFARGRQFSGAQLIPPHEAPITVDITVCETLPLSNDELRLKIGCQITRISAAHEARLQRHVQKIELETLKVIK